MLFTCQFISPSVIAYTHTSLLQHCIIAYCNAMQIH